MLAPAERAERDRRHVPTPRPGGNEIGAESHDHQHGQAPRPIDDQAQELARRGINPVQVLVQQQHGLAAGHAHHLLEQGLEGLGLLPLRAQLERRISATGRNREQGSKQGHDLFDLLGGPRKERLQLFELAFGRLSA
jgi:hypothetical protein